MRMGHISMATTDSMDRDTDKGARPEVPVWDPLVRVGHWLLVAGFAAAYLSEGEPTWFHSWAGYLVAAIVVVRTLWGFVGPRRARFSDFVGAPRAALGYLGRLVSGRSERHLGHSPAGGLMVVVLLLCLGATALSGMATLAVEEGEGPLAPLLAQESTLSLPAPIASARADEDEEGEGYERGGESSEAFEEIHEFLANLTLVLVLLHVGGVIVASVAHRENLVRAMVTGRKRR